MMFGINNSNVTKIELKSYDGTVVGTIGISKNNTSKKKKRLQYNFKELSTQIMRTRTSGSAHQTAVKARQKVALLRAKLRTEDYDDKELEKAIAHAEKMERTARKRMKNLQAEEESERHSEGVCQEMPDDESQKILQECRVERNAEKASRERAQELARQMQELQESMMDLEDETLSEGLPDELMPVSGRDMKPEELEMLKKKHRADEMRDIMLADLEYLKAMFDKLAKEQQETSSGVSLELGGMEVPVDAVPAEVSAVSAAETSVEGIGVDVLV